MTPALYLVPVALGGAPSPVLPAATIETVRALRDFAVENAKSARAFLSGLDMPCPMRALNIATLDQDADALLAPLRAGRSLGVLAEAGCPGIADPGQALVAAAHAAGFRVAPLVGPSA
ncbi:MAG: SAM-dependent methyltransferase, partial [Burkholderiales bacterium]